MFMNIFARIERRRDVTFNNIFCYVGSEFRLLTFGLLSLPLVFSVNL